MCRSREVGRRLALEGDAGVAQRAVGHRDRDAVDGVVDDLVPGHHPQRVGARLAVDGQREHGVVVFEPGDLGRRIESGSSIAGMPSGGGPPETRSAVSMSGSGRNAWFGASRADGPSTWAGVSLTAVLPARRWSTARAAAPPAQWCTPTSAPRGRSATRGHLASSCRQCVLAKSGGSVTALTVAVLRGGETGAMRKLPGLVVVLMLWWQAAVRRAPPPETGAWGGDGRYGHDRRPGLHRDHARRRAVRRQSLEGVPAVLWFWAPWCPTCRAQIPTVSGLGKEYAGRVHVVGVGGLDTQAEIEALAGEIAT